jgi:hypothetical protein
MKCSRCQQENPPQAKFCLECAAPINEATPAPSSSAQTKAEIESLRRSLSEALEQQTATSEILGIISRSPTDVQSVFDVIARSAVRLCQYTTTRSGFGSGSPLLGAAIGRTVVGAQPPTTAAAPPYEPVHGASARPARRQSPSFA